MDKQKSRVTFNVVNPPECPSIVDYQREDLTLSFDGKKLAAIQVLVTHDAGAGREEVVSQAWNRIEPLLALIHYVRGVPLGIGAVNSKCIDPESAVEIGMASVNFDAVICREAVLPHRRQTLPAAERAASGGCGHPRRGDVQLRQRQQSHLEDVRPAVHPDFPKLLQGANKAMKTNQAIAHARALLLVLAGLVAAEVSLAGKENNASPILRLTGEVTGQCYCYTDAEVFSARLKVVLHFVNISTRNVILSRRMGSASPVIAATPEAASQGTFEYSFVSDSVFGSGGRPKPTFSTKPDPQRFVVVPPGGSFETPMEVPIPIRKEDASNIAGTVSKGKHVVKLNVGTWPYRFMRQDTIEAVRKKWSMDGDLITEYVASNFFSFSIPRDVEVKDCHTNPQKAQRAGGPAVNTGGGVSPTLHHHW